MFQTIYSTFYSLQMFPRHSACATSTNGHARRSLSRGSYYLAARAARPGSIPWDGMGIVFQSRDQYNSESGR
jgi:hypothetical protein